MKSAFLCLLVSCLMAFASAWSSAQATYTVHDLGSIGGATTAGAVSPLGHAVGHSYTAPGSNFYHVFINKGAGIQDLGTMGGYGAEANDINAAGQIVGGSSPPGGGHFHAYLFQNGVWTDLGTGGGYRSYAYGINQAGDVVGAWLAANGNWTGFLYRNGVMTDLPSFGGGSGQAHAINDSGEIAGFAKNAAGFYRAYTFADGTLTDLGDLGGGSSFGYDINNKGEVAGYSLSSAGGATAFVYSGGQMHNIGLGVRSQAYAINDRGQTVGWNSGDGIRAFIAYGTTVYDLNALIPADSGWFLREAVDINDAGEIVGVGTLNGASRAFLLKPLPTVSVSPGSVSVGDFYDVSWTAPNGQSSKDWIGFYRVGDPDTAFLAYHYTGGATSGQFRMEANREGTFEFRYFLNNTYNRRAVSNTLTVSIPSGITLTAAPTAVNPGGSVSVSFTAQPGRPAKDWIGLFSLGSGNRQYLWYAFTNGAASGSFTLPVTVPAGDYEFRYLANNGWIDLARSNSFRVNSARYTLEATPLTVSPGGTVTVTWSAPEGSSAKDWIGLYREGEPENRRYLTWFYTGGAASGSRDLQMPATAGRYVLRYLLNNHYTHTAESAVIEVQ